MMFSVVSPQTFCLMMLVVYGGFGATMFPLVNFFYGPDSIIAYFTETSEFETFFARAVGVLFLMVTPGPYVFGVPFEAACKQYLVWNLFSLFLFVDAALNLETGGPGVNALLPISMWIPQSAIGAVFLVLNILVVKDLPKGSAMF